MSLVAVTGATGFVGSRLVKFLKLLGYEVRIFSRKPQRKHETVIHDFEQELTQPFVLNSVDMVIHLAGLAHDMNNTIKNKELYYRVNVDATVELAKLAAKSGVKKFVFVSSVKAGGTELTKKCLDENNQGSPEGLYATTKRKAEIELLKTCKGLGMHISIIRPSLVYGPNAKGNIKLMLSAIKKGWFPPLPEINNKKSMIHVDDLVNAILMVAKDEYTNGEVFIATDGNPYSSREVYNAMCNVLEKPVPKWSVPKILFDIASLASPHIKYKINKLLGDECYSSAKLEALGFKARKTIKQMNETDY